MQHDAMTTMHNDNNDATRRDATRPDATTMVATLRQRVATTTTTRNDNEVTQCNAMTTMMTMCGDGMSTTTKQCDNDDDNDDAYDDEAMR